MPSLRRTFEAMKDQVLASTSPESASSNRKLAPLSEKSKSTASDESRLSLEHLPSAVEDLLSTQYTNSVDDSEPNPKRRKLDSPTRSNFSNDAVVESLQHVAAAQSLSRIHSLPPVPLEYYLEEGELIPELADGRTIIPFGHTVIESFEQLAAIEAHSNLHPQQLISPEYHLEEGEWAPELATEITIIPFDDARNENNKHVEKIIPADQNVPFERPTPGSTAQKRQNHGAAKVNGEQVRHPSLGIKFQKNPEQDTAKVNIVPAKVPLESLTSEPINLDAPVGFSSTTAESSKPMVETIVTITKAAESETPSFTAEAPKPLAPSDANALVPKPRQPSRVSGPLRGSTEIRGSSTRNEIRHLQLPTEDPRSFGIQEAPGTSFIPDRLVPREPSAPTKTSSVKRDKETRDKTPAQIAREEQRERLQALQLKTQNKKKEKEKYARVLYR